MDAWEKAVEEQRKWQEAKGWKTPRWDRDWVSENWLNWEMLRAEFQKWQDSHKCKAEDGKGAFIGLLTEALAAAGALFSTARQELEALQQAKDAEAQAVGLESHSFVTNPLLQQLETNLRPLAVEQLEQEPPCLGSVSEVTEKLHVLRMDNEEEEDFDSGSGSSTPALLPEQRPDNAVSLYPGIKTFPVQLPAPAGEEGAPPLPGVTMTATNFNAEQLRQLSLQYGKKPHEDWVGWVARCYQLGAGTVILNQTEAGQIFLGGRIFLLNPNAGARVNTFSLLSSIIHAVRKMPGPWGYLPPPPWSTPDGFSGWTMRLAARDVLKGQGAIPQDMMAVPATAAGKLKLLQNAAPGGPKNLALMLRHETWDWNTIMAQGLQNWTALLGRRRGRGSTPEMAGRKREGRVRVVQMLKGGQRSKSKGQNARNAEINQSDTKQPSSKQECDLERRRLCDLLRGIGFTAGQLEGMPVFVLQRLWDNREGGGTSSPGAGKGPGDVSPSASPVPDSLVVSTPPTRLPENE
ncbi:hypothetical protein llap_5422 [Limosa lapponica baueri]|uniref:Uncharacterized protein n=1 Tax=Limosa lapponica baueri TaxID=1758121 RepID=A0A2I0UE39_LIMLA|nr:hypothetical protein llap_5422 [Limosa lapponica baueri]